MAKMDPELEQRLRDQLRMIEMGETLEDLDDPEDYEDEGGIRSLNRAPSIKMASETGPEEFELELGTVVKEYLDKKDKGETTLTIEEYINDYLSKKRLMKKMMEERAMAMGGGMMRMNYKDGTEEQARQAQRRALDELPEGLKKDTTTGEGKTIFNIDDYEMIKLPNGEIKYIKKDKKAKGGIAGVL